MKMAGTIADVDFLGSVLRIKVTANDTTIAFDTFNDPSSPPPRDRRQGDDFLLARTAC